MFAGAETDPADPLVGFGSPSVDLVGIDVAVLRQRGRVVENLDDFKVRFLGLGEVVEALLNESQVEGDLRAQIEVFLQSLTGEGVVESVGGILGAVVNAQLAGVKVPGFVIAGVEVQHLLAGGKGVVEAVQPQVQGHQCLVGGGGLGVEAGGVLVGADGGQEAIVVFVKDAEAVEFEGFAPIEFFAGFGASGGERLGPVAYGTLGAHRRRSGYHQGKQRQTKSG